MAMATRWADDDNDGDDDDGDDDDDDDNDGDDDDGDEDVLDGLPVVVEDVHPDHGLLELGVRQLDQLVVQVILVVESVKAFLKTK